MKNKGFTLIEVLAVIVLLTALSLLIVPKIVDIIKDNASKLYENQKATLIKEAEIYVDDKSEELTIGDELCITSDMLYKAGYIKFKTINNPSTNKDIEASVKVVWDEIHNRYNYSFKENNTCAN